MLLGGTVMAAGVFGTGKSLDDLEKAVKKEVTDKSRQDAARAVIANWSKNVEKFIKESGKRQKALTKLMRRHDTTRQELDTIMAEQTSASDGIDQRAIDYRFALKDHLKREEWGRVFAEGH
jgi:Tfp pilus assembly major pilin PilA